MLIILIAIVVILTIAAALMTLYLINEDEIEISNKYSNEIDLAGEIELLEKIRRNKIT